VTGNANLIKEETTEVVSIVQTGIIKKPVRNFPTGLISFYDSSQI